MATPKPDDCKITKINFKAKGFIEVHHEEGGRGMKERNLPMHPDMEDALGEIKSFFSLYYEGLTEEHLTVKQITVTHYEDKEGQSIAIKCVYQHPKSMQNTTFSTSKMQTHEDDYGFEQSLREAILNVSEEAYQYARNMKSSQGNTLGDEDEAE